jgi:pyruvate kinase
MIRRTRIVCTIGPSSSSPAILRTMVQSGMDVARLNFSHGDHPTHRQAAEDVRAAAEAVGRPVALLGDLQGPKIRTGPLDTAFMRLARGRRVVLVGGPRGAADEIEVSHPELVDALRVGDRVLIEGTG